MTVLDVLGDGSAVVLTTAAPARYLSIEIDEDQIYEIAVRTKRRSSGRQLTHDFVDRVISAMGGEVLFTEIVKLQQAPGNNFQSFYGSVTVRDEGRVFTVDARSSDAILLALGHDVPVYASRAVMESAGIDLTAPIDSGIPECDRVWTRLLRCAAVFVPLPERVSQRGVFDAEVQRWRGNTNPANIELRRQQCLSEEKAYEMRLSTQPCWQEPH